MYRRPFLIFVLLASSAAMLLTGCGKKRHTSSRPRPPVSIGSSETGLASWYGYPYHGRQAANGEIYDMEKMTAAHRTLPFGTWVRVTSLGNGKSTDVRITDRGPFIAGRVIDLSHAAARAIDLIGPGVAQVRIEIIGAPPAPVVAVEAFYSVQVGAFRDRETAERLRLSLEQRYALARTVFRDGRPPVWRVLVGAETSIDAAGILARRLQQEVGTAFVVRLDEVPGNVSTTN